MVRHTSAPTPALRLNASSLPDAVLALHDHTHTQCLAHSHGDGRQRTVELRVASQRPHEQPVGDEGARLEVVLAELRERGEPV